jgi:hypothetical protein
VEKAVVKCCPDLPPWWLKQVARQVAEYMHHYPTVERPRSQAPPYRAHKKNLIKRKPIKV